jgi:hypothetical protein
MRKVDGWHFDEDGVAFRDVHPSGQRESTVAFENGELYVEVSIFEHDSYGAAVGIPLAVLRALLEKQGLRIVESEMKP